ncbi:hypothetical protein D8674_017233 [Pyrus ussuriensis x Pyrus communis]|uniref:Uncharacterized protein n=1 Tax=Pyrus ussuriensis x Pyrus communis TaxID=2448454 RepID=A0A5N5HG52_9ROSA|nr:hypothetical protein D8674_017233 [Pyrus ussuriensis x Pyrus communis]
MAAEALVQDRHHNDVLAQPDYGASTASGLSFLRFFSLRTFRLSPQFRYVRESEEIRFAMRPLELIKRVKEIQQEAYEKPETTKEKDTRQTVAVDLSKRLKDLHYVNDATSFRALEEWRKRKMERARLRQLEKNGTLATRA